MEAKKLEQLSAKCDQSYVAHVDLRDLRELCDAALQLTWLRNAIVEAAEHITIFDERKRVLDLLDKVTAHVVEVA